LFEALEDEVSDDLLEDEEGVGSGSGSGFGSSAVMLMVAPSFASPEVLWLVTVA
jgi:hypothetical protein